MKLIRLFEGMVVAALLTGCKMPAERMERGDHHDDDMEREFYLPNAEASRVVSVSRGGATRASILVQTHRAAVKETGPEQPVTRFGEVYSFSPNFIAVHRDESTQIRFWNLQPDDQHDFISCEPRPVEA